MIDVFFFMSRQTNDIAFYIHLSSHMHSVLNAVCLAALENDKVNFS